MLGIKEWGGCPSVAKISIKVTPEPLVNVAYAKTAMIGILLMPNTSTQSQSLQYNVTGLLVTTLSSCMSSLDSASLPNKQMSATATS